MGNSSSVTSQNNNNYKLSWEHPPFIIDRVVDSNIRIGLTKEGDGIKFFPKGDEGLCSFSTIDYTIKKEDSIIYKYKNGSELEISKKNNDFSYKFSGDTVNLEGKFMLPYKTIGLSSSYDEIAKLS